MRKAVNLLDGILVADFSRILAGPLCSQLLADAGARVIKVEERGRGDETRRWGPPFVGGESAYFLSVNRSKESLAVDLKTDDGREIARRLIERADVVLQNFLPAQQELFGLTAAAVAAVNPRAVHCTIRGFDRETTESSLPGYDLLAQAAGGLMSITGERDGQPHKVGVAIADVLTAHHAHGAILSALLSRERGGEVVPVEISLIGATEASLINVAQNYLVTGIDPHRHGNEHPSIVPYQAFSASDRLMVIAVATDRHFHLLCTDVLESDALAEDDRFRTNADRVRRRQELVPLLEQRLRERTAGEWLERCRGVGIPAALVKTMSEVFEASPLVAEVSHATAGAVRLVGSPLVIGESRATIRSAPPRLGEHTDDLLRELGFDAAAIGEMRRAGSL